MNNNEIIDACVVLYISIREKLHKNIRKYLCKVYRDCTKEDKYDDFIIELFKYVQELDIEVLDMLTEDEYDILRYFYNLNEIKKALKDESLTESVINDYYKLIDHLDECHEREQVIDYLCSDLLDRDITINYLY